ncbi:alpha/beta hydrolase [Paracoccus sediminis]|uniref:Alpha/beta hydrolase n=1 Tax=Paracoccus sediminis TaxID=1214787 RepID=A0A238XTZ6_9RHOB|nr:alpha/beta hydrolase [Paracoccus sediminis]TBN47831.1 alpha/beta hydrolase [Paracoccus sediminis]SNR62526.1 Pimeloyl-ACP methyl ester carboxylesterase [Paracoccus sediminis]
MTSRTLPLSDGGTAHILEAGAGEPLLLIHGVGMCADAWRPQIDALRGGYHVVAVDMPGHGGTSALSPTARLPDFVAWAARLVEALDLGPVNLAGHSMGALVSAGLAVERPDLVRRLALLNAVYCRGPEARAAVMARADELARGKSSIDGPLTRWFGDDQAAIRDRVAGWLKQMDLQSYTTAYRSFAEGDRTYAEHLDRIACPALILTGDGDLNSTPGMSVEMAARIPRGRAVIVAGHKHMVNLTGPDTVNDALRTWLNSEVAHERI